MHPDRHRASKLGAAFGLLALLAGGCAVQGQRFRRFEAPPGTATIYVYRPYHYGGSLLRPPVTCGDETARIGPGGYHAFVVPIGKIECRVDGAESTDMTEVEARGVSYIREEIGWGVLTGHPHLNPVDDDTTHDEIRKCCVEETAAASRDP